MFLIQRHRALSTVLLVLTLLVTAVGYMVLPWTYQAKGSIVFVPSQEAGAKFGAGNPYLAFSGSLNQVGDVVRYMVTDKRIQQKLQSEGDTSTYTITDDQLTSAPIIDLTVTGSDPTNAVHTLAGVSQEITQQLAAIQSKLPSNQMVQAKVISYTNTATRLTSKKFRPTLEVFIVGALLSAVVLFVVDTAQSKNKKRSQREQAASKTTTAQAGPVPAGHRHVPAANRPGWEDNDFEQYPSGPPSVQPGYAERSRAPRENYGARREY